MLNRSQSTTTNGAFHVVDVARQVGVTPTTVRYYARVGLLRPAREPQNEYRIFSGTDVHRVRFIRQAQSLGLTIADIREILDIIDRGEVPCHRVVELVELRLAEIIERIAALDAVKSRIDGALESWRSLTEQAPGQSEFCHLIERVADTERGDHGAVARSASRVAA